jgi:hypothetical protein
VQIEHCVQFNMANSHVNSTSCILLRDTVQSSINNCLLYKVRNVPPSLGISGLPIDPHRVRVPPTRTMLE